MNSPLALDLARLEPAAAKRLRILTDVNKLLLKSITDLLHHRQPPLDALVLLKRFAKKQRTAGDPQFPPEVATVIYFLTIAISRARWDKHISRLSDSQLRAGLQWVSSQDWIDGETRRLVDSVTETIFG